MQLLKIHSSYSTAAARTRATNITAFHSNTEHSLLTFYDAVATPSQRWTALQPFLLRFGDGLMERFTAAWTPDAIAYFARPVSVVVVSACVSALQAQNEMASHQRILCLLIHKQNRVIHCVQSVCVTERCC